MKPGDIIHCKLNEWAQTFFAFTITELQPSLESNLNIKFCSIITFNNSGDLNHIIVTCTALLDEFGECSDTREVVESL